jgi:putative spermidine/putrescine transport system permease protein
MHKRRKDWINICLTVFVVLFFIAMLAPILVVVMVSFTSAGYVAFPIPGWSLKWFANIFAYQPFIDGMIVSIKTAIGATLISCVFGVPACLCLARSRARWTNAVMTFLLSPLSMPMIVIGFASLFFLSWLGVGISFAALLITHTVVCLPYVIRTVAGVYSSIPAAYEEAAALLGAPPAKVLWHITLPLIRPGIMAGLLFSFLTSFDNLPISYFLGSADTNTLPVVMLSYLEHQFDPTIAALSSLQLVMALVALLVVDRIYGVGKMTVAV